jgi:hypothetical protein
VAPGADSSYRRELHCILSWRRSRIASAPALLHILWPRRSSIMIYSMADMMALWGWKKKSRRWRRRVLVSMIAHNAKERTTRAYKHRQPRTFGRNRGHALNEMSTLSPIEFLRMFRVQGWYHTGKKTNILKKNFWFLFTVCANWVSHGQKSHRLPQKNPWFSQKLSMKLQIFHFAAASSKKS